LTYVQKIILLCIVQNVYMLYGHNFEHH